MEQAPTISTSTDKKRAFAKRCASTGSLRRIAPLSRNYNRSSNNSNNKKKDETTDGANPSSSDTWQSISLDGIRPVKPLKSCLSKDRLSELIDGTDESNNSASGGRMMKKSVSFHKIEIHEHPRTLGDNPSVSSGPALSIRWDSVSDVELNLEDYEEHRGPRRGRSNLAVPSRVREQMLREEAGVSSSEMRSMQLITAKIKQSRRKSNQSNNTSSFQPIKLVSQLLKGSENNKELQALLEQAERAERLKRQQEEAWREEQERLKQSDEKTSSASVVAEKPEVPSTILKRVHPEEAHDIDEDSNQGEEDDDDDDKKSNEATERPPVSPVPDASADDDVSSSSPSYIPDGELDKSGTEVWEF